MDCVGGLFTSKAKCKRELTVVAGLARSEHGVSTKFPQWINFATSFSSHSIDCELLQWLTGTNPLQLSEPTALTVLACLKKSTGGKIFPPQLSARAEEDFRWCLWLFGTILLECRLCLH
mmetsp:Transcript_28199/g.65269  ORF Transcript_28199/g.65269 Transcript_28199/m.65269 type:complete len:119 (+) Transcript_28199:721-1077(+)